MLLLIGKAILQEFQQAETFWLFLLFAVSYPLMQTARLPRLRQNSWELVLALFLHLLLVPLTAILRLDGFEQMAHLTGFGYGLCALFISVTILTRFLHFYLLPRLGVHMPLIAHDLLLITVSVFGFFVLGAQAGLNIAGVIATSAVVTAVLGLSLQDTLGNVIGGIVLQVDKSFSVGDWIKFNDVSGKVTEISWRFTTVETRNWETVIIPNSQLMKSQVMILGKRSETTLLWRRWIWFHVDYHYAPTQVIELVTTALRNADIPAVAQQPPLNCLLMDFDTSTARYAVRYWLTDPALDDPTDSAVRVHLSYALRRADIPISVPIQTLYLNRGQPQSWGTGSPKDQQQRQAFVAGFPLLSGLAAETREQLAEKLISSAYLSGEAITCQGAEGHWLYLLAEGQVSIRIRQPAGHEAEVHRLQAVDFFGEASLLTGAPRSTSVVALTDSKCYRLDKASFLELLEGHPALAAQIAEIQAERMQETQRFLEQQPPPPLLEEHHSLLRRLRAILGLDTPET